MTTPSKSKGDTSSDDTEEQATVTAETGTTEVKSTRKRRRSRAPTKTPSKEDTPSSQTRKQSILVSDTDNESPIAKRKVPRKQVRSTKNSKQVKEPHGGSSHSSANPIVYDDVKHNDLYHILMYRRKNRLKKYTSEESIPAYITTDLGVSVNAANVLDGNASLKLSDIRLFIDDIKGVSGADPKSWVPTRSFLEWYLAGTMLETSIGDSFYRWDDTETGQRILNQRKDYKLWCQYVSELDVGELNTVSWFCIMRNYAQDNHHPNVDDLLAVPVTVISTVSSGRTGDQDDDVAHVADIPAGYAERARAHLATKDYVAGEFRRTISVLTEETLERFLEVTMDHRVDLEDYITILERDMRTLQAREADFRLTQSLINEYIGEMHSLLLKTMRQRNLLLERIQCASLSNEERKGWRRRRSVDVVPLMQLGGDRKVECAVPNTIDWSKGDDYINSVLNYDVDADKESIVADGLDVPSICFWRSGREDTCDPYKSYYRPGDFSEDKAVDFRLPPSYVRAAQGGTNVGVDLPTATSHFLRVANVDSSTPTTVAPSVLPSNVVAAADVDNDGSPDVNVGVTIAGQ